MEQKEMESLLRDYCYSTSHCTDCLLNKHGFACVAEYMDLDELTEACLLVNVQKLQSKEQSDPVNHPSHYTDGKIEVADYIADKHFDFFLGNAIKYISRAGKKDPSKHVEDLEKAIWYINYEIKLIKGEQE